MKRSRIKVIPDIVFEELWNAAQIFSDSDEYISVYMNPIRSTYLDYDRYGLSYEECFDMLSAIHRYAQLSMKEIIDMTGKSKAEIGHALCIPRRTIENWYYGARECAGYFKLLLLRQYHLLSLGKYVFVESYKEFMRTVPGVYTPRNGVYTPKSEVVSVGSCELEDEEFYARLEKIGDVAPYVSDEEAEVTRDEVSRLLKETEYIARWQKRGQDPKRWI